MVKIKTNCLKWQTNDEYEKTTFEVKPVDLKEVPDVNTTTSYFIRFSVQRYT